MFEFLFAYNDLGILMLRFALGVIMAVHGYPKLFVDSKSYINFLKSLNIPLPNYLAYISGIAEFFGGISVIIGFLTQIAVFFITINMAVALWVNAFKFKKAFVGGYEFDLILLLTALALLFIGPGLYSIDWFLFR